MLLTTWGGTEYAWGSPVIVAPGVAGVALLGAFVLVERRAREPIDRVGIAAAPPDGGLLVTSIGSGQIISRWGHYRPFPIAGTAIMAVGLYLLSRMTADTGYGTQAVAMLVTGLGLGMVMQVFVLAVQNPAEPRDLGVATSGATFFRQIGGSLGVAIFGAIFASRLSAEVAALPGATGHLGRDVGSISPDRLAALPPPVREGFVHAFAEALHVVFLTAVPVAVAGFALAWLLPELRLREGREAAGPGPAVGNVGHDFGMTPTGLMAVREETLARRCAVRAALARLDEVGPGSGVSDEGLSRLHAAYHRRHGSEDVGPASTDRVRRDLTAESAALPT